MQAATITLYRDPHGAYYFHLDNSLGECLLRSGAMRSRSECLAIIERFRELAGRDVIYQRTAGGGIFQFYVRIPGCAPFYHHRDYYHSDEREKVIDEIKSLAPLASIEDATSLIRYFRTQPQNR